MNEILALGVKDLRLLIRDKAACFFTFVFPLIYCIFFGVIFSSQGGGSNRIAIAVVDEDRSPGSRAFLDELRSGAELDVVELDREAATNVVRKGDRVAYLALPPGFGEARERMFFGPSPDVELGIDPSRQAEAGMLQGLLTKSMFQGFQDLFTNSDRLGDRVQGWMTEINKDQEMDPIARTALTGFLPAWQKFMSDMPKPNAGADGGGGWTGVPLKMVEVARKRSGPRNSFAITFPQGIVWGVMGCAAGFGISLVSERSGGTLVRLRMSPLSASRILAGKAVACGLTTLVLSLVMLIIAAVGFGVRPQSVVLLGVAVLSMTIAFVGIMMLLAVLGKTEQSAGGIGWAILTIMAMIGGGMVPWMFLPGFMRTLSCISPVRWSIQAMEGAIWRGYSTAEMALPCGILIAVGAICFVIGTRTFQWSEPN